MLELSNRDTELDEIMGAFNEIQEGFREINEAENRVDLKEGTLESQSAADKIKEDIRFISEKLKSKPRTDCQIGRATEKQQIPVCTAEKSCKEPHC